MSQRERAIERVKAQLLRRGMPRVQMTLILLLTGLAGLLASFILLHLGLTAMWARYPIAILLAYAVFLLLLRLWLSYQRGGRDGGEWAGDANLLDAGADLLGGAGRSGGGGSFNLGGGGDFGGGGAGGSWGQSLGGGSAGGSSGGGSLLGNLDLNVDDEGCGLVVLAVLLIVGGLAASLYVVWAAPVLLAEIVVDGLLVTGLYKRMKGIERRHWLETAVRKTLLPVVIVTVLFGVAGYLMQRAAPEAHSVGGVWSHFASDKR